MPIILLPPWCRFSCSARRCASVSHQLLDPPSASILAFSSAREPLGLLAQPLVGDFAQHLGQTLHAVEEIPERQVEPIVVGLVLDQAEPAQAVEIVDRAMDHPRIERPQQIEQLAQR